MEKNEIIESGNGEQYLIQNHEAFIQAIKNTALEYDVDHKTSKEAWVTVKFTDAKFYIICHKNIGDEKNQELQYFYDRIAGLI